MDDESLDAKAACRFIGGSKPINQSTLWRNIKAGRYSPPDHIGPNMVRWSRNKLKRDLERIATDEAARRGRPRKSAPASPTI